MPLPFVRYVHCVSLPFCVYVCIGCVEMCACIKLNRTILFAALLFELFNLESVKWINRCKHQHINIWIMFLIFISNRTRHRSTVAILLLENFLRFSWRKNQMQEMICFSPVFYVENERKWNILEIMLADTQLLNRKNAPLCFPYIVKIIFRKNWNQWNSIDSGSQMDLYNLHRKNNPIEI